MSNTNQKGVLGQIEGLKASFEAVLRKRTLYRQQINHLTAKLRERNQEIEELKRQATTAHEHEILLVEDNDVLKRDNVELVKMLDEYRAERDEWRDKARGLAAELAGKGNGETHEEPISDSGQEPSDSWVPPVPASPCYRWGEVEGS